ncbi:YHS domain-containing (seleno)protein [Bosea sp. PAMC 26642]|uniref:YHS domain-containing (seleno)protein n=1 Tax=Bosea sp. (strain PAMC 26642) TaxID=1792307 RepID=UPI0007706344|nr:YHS domain-containing (seleno)protein [Bosea sp. PAMC 26642]AMJ60899.1 hypothetical protein AXW83_11870 [Bosea sp. PAMC 26642]
MKATTWRRRIAFAATMRVLALAGFGLMPPTPTEAKGLPDGLPPLPAIGETMQRDTRSGLALGGFDPVAYHVEARATAGRAEFEITHRGDVWRFASAANRAAFLEAPDSYEPAYEAYDATGVAEGLAVDTDPRLFAVVEQRLFLFRTAASRNAFLENTSLRRLAENSWGAVSQLIAHR